jgi:hypothetical protein
MDLSQTTPDQRTKAAQHNGDGSSVVLRRQPGVDRQHVGQDRWDHSCSRPADITACSRSEQHTGNLFPRQDESIP